MRTKPIALTLVCLLTFSTLAFTLSTPVFAQVSSGELADELVPRGPIYIDGNADFTLANGVVAGSGTAEDPYIIENWDTSGIVIRNTTAYFVIRNCYVHDGGSGISLVDCDNGVIENCTASNNYYHGINLSYYCDNNLIKNCIANNNTWGINLGSKSTNNNVVENCTAENNYYSGINLWYCGNNNIIKNCTARNNYHWGIRLHDSDNNVITNCIAENNYYSGINLWLSDYNIIKNCTVSNNVHKGINLEESENNLIENCIAKNNHGDAVTLYSSPNNTIKNCTIKNNGWYGIWLSNSPNNCLRNNTLTNNPNAFGVWSFEKISNFYQDIDTSNKINGKPIYYIIKQKNLTFDGNVMDVGFLGLISCENILVKNLDMSNLHHGILVVGTSYSTVTNCTFSNTRFGIDLYSSSNNIFKNCLVANNGYGITLVQSSNNNIVTNCTFENNQYGAWLSNWWGSWSGNPNNNNHIYHNNFVNNVNQARDNCSNYWDDGYPSGGNYWSDYTGVDEYRGPNQDIPGSDGIGDTPHVIWPGFNKDRYPFMRRDGWKIIPATIDINPDTLNLRSRGKWITAYIGLPEGYDVEDIDVDSISLNGLSVERADIQDGVLMVKFDRQLVQRMVSVGDEVELTVTGEVDGTTFKGSDIIRVIMPGKGKGPQGKGPK